MNRFSYKAAFCGFCAFFTALGITLFAYPVLLPYIIKDNWILQHTANIILNFVELGFILGLVAVGFLKKVLSWKNILRISLLLSAITLGLFPLFSNIYWFSITLLLIGFLPGTIVTATPPYILSTTSNVDSGFVAGIMYSGTGVGFIITSVFIDTFMHYGLNSIWYALASIVFLITILSWNSWPDAPMNLPGREIIKTGKTQQNKLNYIKTITITCILFDIGTSAIILYLDEYLSLYHRFDTFNTSLAWSLVGTGSIAGTLIFGYFSKRIGVKYTYMLTIFLAGTATILLGIVSIHGLILFLTLAGSLGIYAGVAMYAAYNNLLNAGKFSLLSWQIIIFAETISAWLAVLLFGILLGTYMNYSTLFIICGILLILALLVTIFLPDIRGTDFKGQDQAASSHK